MIKGDQGTQCIDQQEDEPEEAAWASFVNSFCSAEDNEVCQAEGCSHAPRDVVGSTAGPNGRIETRWQEEEHFAGPNCQFTAGYSGWDITVEEMKVSNSPNQTSRFV